MKNLGVLKEGSKTITNSFGDTYEVFGTLYKGELMGRGEYTHPNGSVTKTHFYKDVEYGRMMTTQQHNGLL